MATVTHKFELVWLGEIKEDGTEDFGCTIATSKTLKGIRGHANKHGHTDSEYRIDETGVEFIAGLQVPCTVAEHKIKL